MSDELAVMSELLAETFRMGDRIAERGRALLRIANWLERMIVHAGHDDADSFAEDFVREAKEALIEIKRVTS